MYVYIRSEPALWTVGFYKPDGKFDPESDHENPITAAERVHWLNGGDPEPEAEEYDHSRAKEDARNLVLADPPDHNMHLVVARADGFILLDHILAAGEPFRWHQPDPSLAMNRVGLIELKPPDEDALDLARDPRYDDPAWQSTECSRCGGVEWHLKNCREADHG